MNSMAIELLAPRYAIAWYPWAVQYFFLIALSYATLWLAAPALVFGRQRWLPTARLAMLACLTTTLVAPVALLADLHQPLRFWHFYAYATSSSWMSIGSLLLPLYVVGVLLLAWLAWRPALQANRQAPGLAGLAARLLSFGSAPTPRAALVLVGLGTLALSTGIMLYTGAELAVVKARPLWNTVWLPPMLVATGFIAAAGLILVLNRVSGLRDQATIGQMLRVLLGACLVAGLVAGSWFLDGINANVGSVAAALDSVRHSPSWRSTALWGGLTGVALFGAVLYLLTRPAARRPALFAWAWVLGLVAIHMGWMFRWVVLMDVQHVARNSAGFHHYGIPAGSSGLLGIVGTFGLWLAAALVIDLLIPWRQARQGGSAADVSLSDSTASSDSTAQSDAQRAAQKIEGAPSHG
ncbi:polysulfide reductase NrfD [Halomonas desiderata]|uniref:Polysulfide reductase NrfD n=1 Tax=Billgrantia desiderata TaxID=52021 RepID=A0ABS9B543_9GAMM|nr:NrfD/PsrC family molybdoenzyme membrane anchor subunit [Halomonas desiderata]MCE8010746.1 polysulfide reductase NrfD [Halomonas desiderata]MCE8042084.1 polysulfide reductase NrfD [Halomonas desiderata]MCE8046771.1 polysulfide reductase NrfD [Halomonas desiderata]NIC36995.1 polysulfide reductase NrfD [Halomonas desiderata]